MNKNYKKTKYPNIYKNEKNGTYAVDLSLGYDYTGKRIRTTRTGITTEKEAKEILKNLEYQSKAKQSITFDYKFEDLLEEYFEWCLYSDKQKKTTVKGKRTIFNKHICPFFNNGKLSDFDGNDILIKNWHKKLIENKTITDDTRYKIHKTLSAYCNWLKKHKKIIKTNPCALVKNFTLPHHEIQYYNEKQIKILRNTILTYDDKPLLKFRTLAIFDMIYSVGLRLGELQGFKFSDFDFDLLNNTVCDLEVVKASINRNIVYGEYGMEESNGKTHNSLDTIFIGNTAINSVLSYINYCKNLGIDFCYEDYIFKNPHTNKPYAQHTIRTDIDFFIKLANLPHRKIKELRNSTASYLISHNFTLKEVQDQLRHTSIKTTEKHYASLYEENKINRAKALNDIL